jgi:hypothetical protein
MSSEGYAAWQALHNQKEESRQWQQAVVDLPWLFCLLERKIASRVAGSQSFPQRGDGK